MTTFPFSHGTYINRMLIYPTAPQKYGYQLDATGQIKAGLTVPVVGVGRITSPEQAEQFLSQGKCDFVGMARALVADPKWAEKALTGKPDTIRPCVGANWCMSRIFAQAPLGCIHNPAAGQELDLDEYNLPAAGQEEKGCGLLALLVCSACQLDLARRGHQVILFEAQAQLGGQLRWWSQAESRRELVGIIDWLAARAFQKKISNWC